MNHAAVVLLRIGAERHVFVVGRHGWLKGKLGNLENRDAKIYSGYDQKISGGDMTDMIRVSALMGYCALMTELGGEADALLRRFNIAPEILEHQDNLIPYRTIIRLMEETAATLCCPDFGLRLAQQQGFEIIGPIALIGLNSPTVGHAMAAMIDHIAFYSPACLVKLDTTTDPLYPRITFDTTVTHEPRRRQTMELAVGVIVRDLETLTNGSFVARHILFRHSSPLSDDTYRRYFKTRALFEQDVNAVVLRPEDLARPLNNADPTLRNAVANYVSQSIRNHPLDIGAQVAFLVRRLLPTQRFGLADIAQHLCMHERTLQRRLRESRLSFESIVDMARHERAEELLRESRLPMTQIATMLGYEEQASLNRACQRWFGKPPRMVRAEPMPAAG